MEAEQGVLGVLCCGLVRLLSYQEVLQRMAPVWGREAVLEVSVGGVTDLGVGRQDTGGK